MFSLSSFFLPPSPFSSLSLSHTMSVAVIEYTDLISGGPAAQDAVLRAFGDNPECLGIVLVRGVPGYQQLRQKLLPLTNRLVKLPPAQLQELELPESSYMFGWSLGKEKFGGKPGLVLFLFLFLFLFFYSSSILLSFFLSFILRLEAPLSLFCLLFLARQFWFDFWARKNWLMKTLKPEKVKSLFNSHSAMQSGSPHRLWATRGLCESPSSLPPDTFCPLE